jgi:flavorubredoxin
MDVPMRFLPTLTIAPETFLIRQAAGEGMGPVVAPINSMVIRGSEPVVIDTGVTITRDQWLDHLFQLVEPDDVRWIFLSHDDIDHTGAVFQLLEACPRATIVTNMFSVLRMAGDRLLPLHRLRIVNPGESFEAGDRVLTAIVPPTYDSPTTRGLYDPTTGVYWAADSFSLEASRIVDDVDELDDFEREQAYLHSQRMVSPWHCLIDPVAYDAHLGRLRMAHPTAAVGAHGPVFRGRQVDAAFELFRQLPHLPPAPLVSQSDLELILMTFGSTTAAA